MFTNIRTVPLAPDFGSLESVDAKPPPPHPATRLTTTMVAPATPRNLLGLFPSLDLLRLMTPSRPIRDYR